MISLLLVFGSQTPLYGLFRELPLGASFRLPDRFLVLLSLALAIGAACGFDRLLGAIPGATPILMGWTAAMNSIDLVALAFATAVLVMIPGAALGRTMRRIVCHLVAPQA